MSILNLKTDMIKIFHVIQFSIFSFAFEFSLIEVILLHCILLTRS